MLIKGRKDSLVKAFEAVCCRARHLARRDGNRAITQADLEIAISEVIPANIAPLLQAAARKSAAVPQRETRLSAPPSTAKEMPALAPRAIKPARVTTLEIRPV